MGGDMNDKQREVAFVACLMLASTWPQKGARTVPLRATLRAAFSRFSARMSCGPRLPEGCGLAHHASTASTTSSFLAPGAAMSSFAHRSLITGRYMRSHRSRCKGSKGRGAVRGEGVPRYGKVWGR